MTKDEKLTFDEAEARVAAGERPVDVFADLAREYDMPIGQVAELALQARFKLFRADMGGYYARKKKG